MKSTEQVLLEWATDEIRFDPGKPDAPKVYPRDGFSNLTEAIKTGDRWYLVHPGEVGGKAPLGRAFKLADEVVDWKVAMEISLYNVKHMTPRWMAQFESIHEALDVIASGRMLVG